LTVIRLVPIRIQRNMVGWRSWEVAILSRKSCSLFRIAAPFLAFCLAAAGSAEAATLTARGNEPGWHVVVSDKAISFRALEGETFTIEPVPQPTTTNGTDVYTATVDGRHFTLTIAEAVCVDTMTGMPYPKTATVMMDDRKLAGCAGEPADLLHGDWPVEMIAGSAIVAGSQPTLAFDQDGSIHGNGSCNRFLGKFTLNGEGLTISETGASMMMCDQPLMDQERNLLAALEAVRRFEVASTGQLRLLGKDGQTLVSLGK